MFKSSFEQKSVGIMVPYQKWLGALRQQKLGERRKEKAEAKQGNDGIGCSLSICLIQKVSLAVCDGGGVLKSDVSAFRHSRVLVCLSL